jgi:TnpA family transposase
MIHFLHRKKKIHLCKGQCQNIKVGLPNRKSPPGNSFIFSKKDLQLQSSSKVSLRKSKVIFFNMLFLTNAKKSQWHISKNYSVYLRGIKECSSMIFAIEH